MLPWRMLFDMTLEKARRFMRAMLVPARGEHKKQRFLQTMKRAPSSQRYQAKPILDVLSENNHTGRNVGIIRYDALKL